MRKGTPPAANDPTDTALSFGFLQTSWKKYAQYHIEVDPEQDDKANELILCSTKRPHMRAFHCAWWAFFVAFFAWFSITPLLNEIRDDLNLTDHDVWTSAIAGVGSTIAFRLLLGPLCDVYGARVLFAVLLCVTAIPTACTGFIQNAFDLSLVRGFIGIAGGSFVIAQYWSSRFFTKEIVGTANAMIAGWGNLGAGVSTAWHGQLQQGKSCPPSPNLSIYSNPQVSQVFIGSYFFPMFRLILDDSEKAWRTVCVLPAILAFATGIAVYRISDDAPKGNYNELKRTGQFPSVTTTSSFFRAVRNPNAWILFVHYACCFGVELTMNNASALYFRDEFGQSTEAAAAIAAIFGWLNLFARGLGGFLSDYVNYKQGMRGRLWMQSAFLLAGGVCVVIFPHAQTLAGSIVVLIFFSLFVQAAEGTTYAIVPYVDPPHMGSVSGLVGAGGNVGGVLFGLGFRAWSYSTAFSVMGAAMMASSLLSAAIYIKGHAGLLSGKDSIVDKETGEIIDPTSTKTSDEAGATTTSSTSRKGEKKTTARCSLPVDTIT